MKTSTRPGEAVECDHRLSEALQAMRKIELCAQQVDTMYKRELTAVMAAFVFSCGAPVLIRGARAHVCPANKESMWFQGRVECACAAKAHV